MAWLDNFISYLSPEAGLRRKYFRGMEASYKGGVPTRTSEPYERSQGFRFGTSQDRELLIDNTSRAYNAYKKNYAARTLVQTETDDVIGDGLNYQPTSSDPEWNKEAKDRYYAWMEEASVRGGDIFSGCELQRMLWSRSRVAGDLGWILVAQENESRIQIVQRENIVTPDDKYSDNSVYDGIKFDALGRPIEFYVLSNDERGGRSFTTIPARDFVFLPHMTEPNQARGETCYITIFDLLSQLDRYIDGVSLAAWMATVFGLIIKKNNPASGMNTLPFVTNGNGNQQRAITLEGAQVKVMGTDEEVVQVNPTQPMQGTDAFIRQMFRVIGQPFDMPLEVFAKDMSTCNFASARIGLLPYQRTCRIKTARFASRWSRTTRWWLSRERQRPDGDQKKWRTPFPEDYWNHEFLPNAFDYTDPVSEAQSDLLQIDIGTKTHQMVISERGRDAEQILREQKEWAKKLGDRKTVHSTMTRDPATADPNGPDPELERIKAEADAYGVNVRDGKISPQAADEAEARAKLKLPPMGPEVLEAWQKDKGVRRPITLTPPGGEQSAPAFGQPAPKPAEDPDSTQDGDNNDEPE